MVIRSFFQLSGFIFFQKNAETAKTAKIFVRKSLTNFPQFSQFSQFPHLFVRESLTRFPQFSQFSQFPHLFLIGISLQMIFAVSAVFAFFLKNNITTKNYRKFTNKNTFINCLFNYINIYYNYTICLYLSIVFELITNLFIF